MEATVVVFPCKHNVPTQQPSKKLGPCPQASAAASFDQRLLFAAGAAATENHTGHNDKNKNKLLLNTQP